FGGWSGAINAAADDQKKNAVYDFFSYMSRPENSNVDVTIGKTGFNPYRTSQFLNRQAWVEAGMSPEAATVYLGAIEDSLNSPNMVLDLRVPQNQRYQGVVLDLTLSQFLAGELTLDEAAQQIYDQWEEITDELGREDQLAAYRASIGAQ
ncbi:MAG: ABC transporter substrate-binding protein, partial [Chloroflexi bacterium]